MHTRLFIVYSNLDLGGIPIKIIDIVNAIYTTHPKTDISVYLQKGHANDLRSLIINTHVIIHDFSFPFQKLKRPAFIIWIWWNILRYKPTTILTFISPYALPVLAAKLLFFWQYMHVVVSEDHYTQILLHSMVYPYLERWGVWLLYPRADVLITPTNAIRRQLSELCVLPKNTRIIPNWTRYAKIPITSSVRDIDIISTGRLVASKNPGHVLHIMHQFISQVDGYAKCMIVGDGPERTYISTYISNHNLQNNIKVLPSVHNISKYLLRSKIFLFIPQEKSEGFPITILDAMACGTVVLSKSFTGIEEVVNHNQNGYIVNTDRDMIVHITEIRKRPEVSKSLVLRAKSLVSQRHSLINTNQYIASLFKE